MITTPNPAGMVPVDALLFGSVQMVPLNVEDWHTYDEDDDEPIASWAELFNYTDVSGAVWKLLAENGRVSAVVFHGKRYVSGDFYDLEQDWSDDNGTDIPIDEREFEGLLDVTPENHGASGPTMNYWYPTTAADDDEAVMKIDDLPLCVVTVDNVTGLALTGGGMDLSWEIIEAFCRLGQLPPVHFAGSLPAMAGRGTSDLDRYIIGACIRALREYAAGLNRDAERIADRFTDTSGL